MAKGHSFVEIGWPKRILYLILLPLFLTVLAACDRNTMFHHYQPIPSEGWARTDTLRFLLPTTASDGDYMLNIALRYTNAFLYEGIWVVAETQLQHPFHYQRDTLYLITCDSLGQPMGRGIQLMQCEMPLTNLSMHQGQQGTVSIRHIMAQEVLPEITDVGLRVQRQL